MLISDNKTYCSTNMDAVERLSMLSLERNNITDGPLYFGISRQDEKNINDYIMIQISIFFLIIILKKNPRSENLGIFVSCNESTLKNQFHGLITLEDRCHHNTNRIGSNICMQLCTLTSLAVIIWKIVTCSSHAL